MVLSFDHIVYYRFQIWLLVFQFAAMRQELNQSGLIFFSAFMEIWAKKGGHLAPDLIVGSRYWFFLAFCA
jgi:hypothetical protein